MRKSRHRGIVLISVIFISVLIGMYMVSATILNRSRFGGMRQTAESRLAEEAARSGLEYALARLEENPNWRGGLNTTTVNTPDLIVVEDEGNVVGIMKTGAGTAQFRLRFNHQNGSGGTDNMDDPSGPMLFDSPHISQNNLTGRSDALLYYGDGVGNSASTVAPNVVEPGAVALVVEGRVSRGFDQATAANPNPSVSRVLSARVVEGFYRVKSVTSEQLTDAVGMAGGKFDAKLYDGTARMLLGDTRDTGNPTIRVRGGDMTVEDVDSGSDGTVDGTNGEIRVGSGSNVNADLATGIGTEVEQTNDHFYQLVWDDVTQPSGTNTLQAGVYEVRDDGRIYRYEMNFEDYKSYKTSNPNDESSMGVQVTLDGSNGVRFIAEGEDYNGQPSDKNRLVLTDDVLIESVGGVVDLTITPAQGAKEDLDDGIGGPGTATYRTSVDWENDHFQTMPSLNAMTSSKNNALRGFVQNLTGTNPTSGSDLHKFLLEMADEGTISLGPSADGFTWDQTTLTNVGNGANAFEAFVNGSLDATNMVNPNTEALPSGGSTISADVDQLFDYYKAAVGSGSSPEAMGEFSSSDSTSVTSMEVTFDPQNQDGVRLANAENQGGDIRIAADVRGSGGSIKSDGQIRMIGVGFDIDAGAGDGEDEGPGVSLFAKDDITLSTLKPDGSGNHEYAGMELKGMVYSWKNIELKAGHEDELSGADPNRVFLQGAMVAYGGIPGDGNSPPGTNGGNILLTGDQLDLIFDPTHLVGLRNETGLTVTLEVISRSYR
jgi:hypothetical protein